MIWPTSNNPNSNNNEIISSAALTTARTKYTASLVENPTWFPVCAKFITYATGSNSFALLNTKLYPGPLSIYA